MTYVYVFEDVDVCDGVCGGEAFDGGGGGELGISEISEMVESSSKRLCSATGCGIVILSCVNLEI